MPKNVNKTNFLWLAGGVVIAVLFLPAIFSPAYKEQTAYLIRSYPLFAPLIIMFFRFIGVVLAPLPGSPTAFASMALLPWREAFMYNFIGSELGSVAAFFIARHFREPVVEYVAPFKKVREWQNKISEKRQFWGFAGLRVISVTAFDFVSYAAGLSKLSFRTFLVASLLVDIPVSLLFFYLGGLAVGYSVFLFAVFSVIFIIALLLGAIYEKNGQKTE